MQRMDHPRYAMMGRRSYLASSVTEDSHDFVTWDRTHLLTRQLVTTPLCQLFGNRGTFSVLVLQSRYPDSH